ncbi:MAG: hypothetical protein NZ879_00925 [Archaeoglobaceae archaeon]|nr:hypothetical protein [Archaeoglobaceae archaeon]MDW8117529.1 hypothetical protein [Archaeoglobaceae archaeon]
MPAFWQLGDVILQGLSSLFGMLKELFIYLVYTGRNETRLVATRTDYQSFWEIWYNGTAMMTWLRKMLFEDRGFIWHIRNNTTVPDPFTGAPVGLRDEFSKVVEIAAGNGTKMFGDAQGQAGITFLLRAATQQLSNASNNQTISPEFILNFWAMLKNLILLVSDALRLVPTVYFPP